ncbi:unnamed protein product [Sphagnum troendelagicum]|uniref:Clp R domain-containing protein n=1 Tax=Sphagnum troendelagicum TaxID=128251 RepID=A0ABP0V4U3_9BRYO
MRAGANWVQHTLTPAAQSVLKHAIAEARRRGHAQVQPLHVAAMLLTHSESRLREAWMHAGPTPLRALEVCFNVALGHLAQSGPAAPSQPTLSNALVAALKRAHAHQRRGCCPEQQQPPLLAVKVELEQLIISVLDDPSVSRVIKEAGSSSAHIKGNLEDNNNNNPLISLTPSTTGCLPCTSSLPGLRPSGKPCSKPEFSSLNMNGFMSFRAPGVELGGKENDICRLMEILLRSTKRNALLVVDSDSSACASAIVKDLALRIKKGQVPEQLHGLQVLEPQLSSSSFALCSQLEIEQKLGELSRIVDECMPEGALLHLGDLQWLSDPVQVKKGTASFCPAQHAVAELERLLLCHAGSRLWFVGVATQQVFARCQARHPELEGRWGLQPLQVASTASPSSSASQQLDKLVKDPGSASQGLYPVHGKIPNEGPTVRPSYGDGEVGDKLQCCTECLAKFEQERHRLHEHERLSLHLAPAEWCSLSSGGALNEGRLDTHGSQVKSQSVIQKLKELQRKWQGTCQSVHAHLHAPVSSILKTESSPLSQKLANGSLVDGKTHMSLQNTTVSGNPLQRRPQWQIHQERMQERTGNASPLRGFPWQMASSKGTQPKTLVTNTPAPGINQGPPLPSQERITERLKGLYKALLSRVGWQGEAVAAITSTVMNCRSGMGRMRGVVPKIDSWLLLLGPDPVAKRLIAKALAEIVAGSDENLVFLGFGDQTVSKLETDRNGIRCRGRSSLDRLAEAVRMKPISVLLLEDIDKADTVVRGSLLRAMERGKMADSSGREVNFGNVIVLMTSSIGAEDLVPEQSLGSLKFLEEKLVDLGVNGFLKRKVDWPILRQPEQRVQLKRPKLSFSQRQALVLDLNLLAEENEDSLSSATTGQSQKACRRNQAEDEDMTRDRVLGCARDRLSDKFCELLDYAVVLKPYDFSGVAGRVLAQLTKAFERITTEGASLEVDVTVLEHILAVIWWGSTIFDTWVADVVGKSVAAVLADVSIAENTVIKLVGDSEHGCRRANTRESIFSGPQLPLFIEISRST